MKFSFVIEPAKPVGVISSFCTSIPSTLPDGDPEGTSQNLSPSTVPYSTILLLAGSPRLGSASSNPRKAGRPGVCFLCVDSPAYDVTPTRPDNNLILLCVL